MSESYYNSSFSFPVIADLTESKQRELFALFCAQLDESGYREFEYMIFNLYRLYTPYNQKEYPAALRALSSAYRDTVLADRAFLKVYTPKCNWSFNILLDENTGTEIESALSVDSLRLDSGEPGIREYAYCLMFVNLPEVETMGTHGIPVMMNEQGEKLLYYSKSILNKAHVAARELCDKLVSMVEHSSPAGGTLLCRRLRTLRRRTCLSAAS